jgi:hypothetical protein
MGRCLEGHFQVLLAIIRYHKGPVSNSGLRKKTWIRTNLVSLGWYDFSLRISVERELDTIRGGELGLIKAPVTTGAGPRAFDATQCIESGH